MSVVDIEVGATVAPGDRRWWPLVGLLLLVDLVFVVLSGIWYADYLRDEGPPFPPGATELIWIHGTAIALGLIVATPAFAIIRRLGRHADVPLGAAVLAIQVGALGFLLAAHLNDWIVMTVGLVPGFVGAGGFDTFGLVVAPAVEEPMKLLALAALAFLLRPRFGVREGIVLGLLVGIGATLIEAGVYVLVEYVNDGGTTYGTIIALRFGLFGLGLHAVTAALTGAGLGYAVSARPGSRRIGVIVVALAGAISLHVLWNLLASRLTFELVMAWAPEPGPDFAEPIAQHVLWVASSLVTAVVLAPATLALAVAWRRSRPGSSTSEHEPAATPTVSDATLLDPTSGSMSPLP